MSDRPDQKIPLGHPLYVESLDGPDSTGREARYNDPAYQLGMMGLQSERYQRDPDYRDAVDAVLAATAGDRPPEEHQPNEDAVAHATYYAIKAARAVGDVVADHTVLRLVRAALCADAALQAEQGRGGPDRRWNISCECGRGPMEVIEDIDAGVTSWRVATLCTQCLEESALRAAVPRDKQ